MLGFEAGLFPQLALRSAQRFFAFRAASFRYLPRVLLQRVTILADEINVIILNRQNADGDVLVVHHAEHTWLAVGTDDLILTHGDPRIVVDLLRGESFPRPFRFVRHHGFPVKHPLSAFSGTNTKLVS